MEKEEMMSERAHAQLRVWRKAIEFVSMVYQETRAFPKEETYGLVSQMRRAAMSIPSNIAEGAARHTTKEYVQFLYASRGSLSELDTQIEIAYRLKYLSQKKHKEMLDEINQISRMLSGLIKAVARKQ